ncbi:uncharacterized protein K02A2.6-like [Cydia pomonella]|uniref:uncharacterized protein K02A2.6-like n=1 Tax=Cydia pomonella TaxID=82600 RepID=UPI002ADDEBE0|nr:uncharacterized protein K02A2.6-like [Cydia pomonella]XP_061713509.1 uncharacterized protein K02A2.6-like [Cydia pomonella]
MTQVTSTIPSLDNFDCGGDPVSVGVRWEKWKRALEIYFLAANIEEDVVKRATLLHLGGLALQEVYYNLPGAHAEKATDVDVYNVAMEKLDAYFSPKQSRYYERYIFRLMKQDEGERFEAFLVRLRQQADKCKFTARDENLIDQIIEKGNSSELRKKILSAGDSVTLQQVITIATTLETVNRQLDTFGKTGSMKAGDMDKSDINKIDTRKLPARGTSKTCYRCGSNKHLSFAPECPAMDKKCLKCGIIGHFKDYCKTKKLKRKFEHKKDDKFNNAKRQRFDHPQKDTEEVDYVFHLDNDEVINCQVGGVTIEMLIDSGCRCNIITDETWEYLKSHNVKTANQIAHPDKTLVAYGSQTPLDVTGKFEAQIYIRDGLETMATLYVIRNGSRNLLGRITAKQLGVLQTGIPVNNISTFPKFKGVKIQIPIDDKVKPVIQPYRRIPIPLEAKVNSKLTELLEADIIEEVNGPSQWVSPMVPVLKENGDLRICIDMRRANEAIIRENHPLPTMDELLPHFRQAKFFSRLDIKNAFHQLEIDEDSRHITTFSTSKGLFRYKRLMFGVSCAPEMFQKVLEKMLLGCEGTANFIDDIIIYGSDEKEHDTRLKKVLQVLKDNDVLLNEAKCIYKTNKIEFLGHELTANGVKPLDKYILAIQSAKRPTNVEEIQSFLGLVNYVGKWIPNLASLTEPLRQLVRLKLSKTTDLRKYWTSSQEQAFDTLKASLSNIQTLGYYNPADRTQIVADASPVGLGALLIQIDRNGPRIIAFGNKSLTDCEKRYCQTEKEALALVWAVEHFKTYLFGKEFEIISDHKPLETIFGPRSKPCARIERWVLRLQAYKYKVIYRPGKDNIADPISRLCQSISPKPFDNENYINAIVQYSRPTAVPLKEIEAVCATDEEIMALKSGIYENKWHESISAYKAFQTEICFQGNIALRGNKLIIPKELRDRVLEAAHQGHPGIVAMKTRLRTKVWWPKIDRDAENRVKACKGCTLVSAPNPPHPIKRRELPVEPWIDVAVDFLGPLPSNDYLLVLIDYYSRYKEIKIMRSITAVDTVSVLKEIFSRLGYPVTLTCDNGNQFTSETFKTFCKECNIVIYNTIPYWPQMNGEVERQNRDILKRLKISQVEKKNWKDDLLEYLIMYNSTPHTTTGKTPSELFFRRQFRDKIPTVADMECKILDSDVRDRDKEKKEKGREYTDTKRKAKDSNLEIGEKVYVKNLIRDNKLTPNFNPESHTVTDVSGGDVRVRNDVTGKEYRRNVVHLKKTETGEWAVINQNSSNAPHADQDQNED